MRKNLLKSLFVAAALVAGTNYALAVKINATLDHTAGAQWGSNTDIYGRHRIYVD